MTDERPRKLTREELEPDPGFEEASRDTAKFHSGRPAFFQDRPVRQTAPLTWHHVVLVLIVMVGLVAVAWACAWGVQG
jgi:hypothetical protein